MKARYIYTSLAVFILVFLVGYALSFHFIQEESSIGETPGVIVIMLIVIDVLLFILAVFMYKNENLKQELAKSRKQLDNSLFLHQEHASED